MEREDRRETCGKGNYAEEETFQAKKSKEIAFIVGGGTSFREVLDSPYMIGQLSNYITFGCNKVVETVDCDYLVYYDLKFSKDYAHLVTGFNGRGGVYAPLPSALNRDQVNETAKYFKPINHVGFDINKGLNSGNNCGVTALSVAVALGYKTIYLLGMDARFGSGESHYHGGYGHNVNENVYTSFAHYFEMIGRHIKENTDVKVYNCSYISLIDIDEEYFERIDIKDVLNVDSTTRERKESIRDALQECT